MAHLQSMYTNPLTIPWSIIRQLIPSTGTSLHGQLLPFSGPSLVVKPNHFREHSSSIPFHLSSKKFFDPPVQTKWSIYLRIIDNCSYAINITPVRNNMCQYANHSLSVRWFTSKQPKLGLTQEMSFSLDLVSPPLVTHLPPVWDRLLPLA